MRSLLARVPRSAQAGALVFVFAFCLYATTTQQLTGYEPETAAVAQGLVLDGQLRDTDDPLIPYSADLVGRDGYGYARTGLLQPVIEAPFYAAGHLLDETVGYAEGIPNGMVAFAFFNPFIAALGAVAIFALILMTRRSLSWAIAIAVLYTVASLAWPYSKIGMETTFMSALIVAIALAVWAREKRTPLPWALTGFAAGAAASTKPYALITLLGIAILLWPTFAELERERRLRLLAAIGLPVLFWFAAMGWYNWYRFESVSSFGYEESSLTLSAPLNALGLLFSPGKGLIFYSPLVVLGALGMPRLWRADRALAAALLFLLVTIVCISGASTYWGDEVWGPRYIVPVAWTLLVPIAWWADSLTRRRVLVAIATVAVLVQVVAVSTQYARYITVVRALSGVQVYGEREGRDPAETPYGNDSTRWIPQLSALLLQTGVITSQVVEKLGGDGITVTYDPFEGPTRSFNLSDPSLKPQLDVWWNRPVGTISARLVAMMFFLLALASGAGLYLMASGRRLAGKPA